VLQRYECKYRVPESVARHIRASAQPFIEPDPYAAGRPGFTYPISSLYLDSEDLRLYAETREGQRARFKLRVRAYTDDPDAIVVVEIKRRQSGVVQKHRARLPRPLLPALLAGQPCDRLALTEADQHVLNEFGRLMLITRARPRVLVRYDREAYIGRGDRNTRITFDRRLRAAETHRPEVRMGGTGFRSADVRDVIVELKFDNRCPAWMQQLVERFELRRTSFSKYCTGIDCTLGRRLTASS
jgi:SPX domain protein involved in polyphosphate accumulation